MDKLQTGMLGERTAARYLRDNGYRILSANYRTRFGEIDIIAEDGKYICFVEVKTRGSKAIATPGEFVDLSKQKKLILTANMYLSNNETNLQPRFDVFEVTVDENGKVISKNHIKNAFTTE